jgi:hypothetical protein
MMLTSLADSVESVHDMFIGDTRTISTDKGVGFDRNPVHA